MAIVPLIDKKRIVLTDSARKLNEDIYEELETAVNQQ